MIDNADYNTSVLSPVIPAGAGIYRSCDVNGIRSPYASNSESTWATHRVAPTDSKFAELPTLPKLKPFDHLKGNFGPIIYASI
jgi:hypothetical protein